MNEDKEKVLSYLKDLCSFEGLIDRDGILEVTLSTKRDEFLKLTFNNYLFYRKMNAGDAVLTINKMSKLSLLGESFYIIESSDLLDWFIEESGGIYNTKELWQCRIVTENDIIEIICINDALVQEKFSACLV